MNKHGYPYRLFAVWLILSLGLPPPACALRPMGTENQETIHKIRAGLEEKPGQGSLEARRAFLAQVLSGSTTTAKALAGLPEDPASWGITVKELRTVLVPLSLFYSRLRADGFDVRNEDLFDELRRLRKQASGILSRKNIHPEISQWFSGSEKDFEADLDKQVKSEEKERSVYKVNAQRMKLELTHPGQVDLWRGVERAMRYALDWGGNFPGTILRFGYSGKTVPSVLSEAQKLGIQSGEKYLVYFKTHKLLPILEVEWAPVERRLKQRGVIVKPRLGVDQFLEEFDRRMENPNAKISTAVRVGSTANYMRQVEHRVLDEALAPLIQQFRSRLVRTFGQEAVDKLPSYEWPDWASIVSWEGQNTLEGVFNEISVNIWNRVRNPLRQELEHTVIQQLQKGRRDGRQITDEEIEAAAAQIRELPDEALNPQESRQIAQTLLEPHVNRPVSNIRASDGIQGLAEFLARDAVFRSLDLWVHVNLDGTLYDLYWVPAGKERDAAIQVLSRVELDLLQESNWHRPYRDLNNNLLRPALQQGTRYRFRIPLGIGPQAIALQLWRSDWRYFPTTSRTGNVIEVAWPLGLPAPPPETLPAPGPDRAGLEEGAAVPTVTQVPFGDWEKLLNRWLLRDGVLKRETDHLGEGEFWTRLIILDDRISIVELLVDEDWVGQRPAMKRQLSESSVPTTGGMRGRPLVQLVVNRYRREDGQEVLLIERVQILRGPQKLKYGEELETRAELVELMGRWGKEKGIPVYLIRPEVMRGAKPELSGRTIHRNYYEPVDRRDPRLWKTVGLRVIGSAFLGSEDQTDNWFLYRGNDMASEAAGLEEVVSIGVNGLKSTDEKFRQAGGLRDY